MTVLIVPCRPGSRGGVAARDAYVDDLFREWRRHAESSGHEWFVLSSKHGLLRPDDLVPDSYDRRVGEALRDPGFLAELGGQLRAAGLRPTDVEVVDADWFQELVARGFGVPKESIRLRKVTSRLG